MQRNPALLLFSLVAILMAGVSAFYLFYPAEQDDPLTSYSNSYTAAQDEPASKNQTEKIEENTRLPPLELGASGEWEPILSNGGQANFRVISEAERLEVLQVEIQKPGTSLEWDIQVVRENISLSQDFKQKLAAWVKGPVGSEITFSVEARNYHLIQNKNVILVGEWQKVVFEFITHEAEIRTAIHFSYPHNEAATILIDDIQVEASP